MNLTVGLILDVIAIGVMLVLAFLGLKRGFTRELISVLGVAIALVAAYLCSGITAKFIYNTVADNIVVDKVYTAFTKASNDTVGELRDAIPDYIVRTADNYDLDITEKLHEVIGSSDAKKQEISQNICDTVARPVLTAIIRIVVFIVLFIVVKILLQWLARTLDIFVKLPIIKTANEFLGFIFGLLKGAVFVGCIALLIMLFIKVSGKSFIGLKTEDFENSHVLGFLKANIFDKFIVS